MATAVETKPILSASTAAVPPAAPAADALRLDQSNLSKSSVSGLVELLRKHLKANFPQYWKWLKQFCQGKLSKQELDINLRKVLPTKEYLTLHNWFVISILRTALSSFVNRAIRKPNKVGFATRAFPYRRKSYGWDSSEPNVEFAALMKRMKRAANQHQLQDVQPEAVHLMLQALEKHLGRVISAVHPQVTRQPDIGELLGPNEEQVLTSYPGDISGPDIDRAATRRPNILGDNPSLLLQRFSVDNE